MGIGRAACAPGKDVPRPRPQALDSPPNGELVSSVGRYQEHVVEEARGGSSQLDEQEFNRLLADGEGPWEPRVLPAGSVRNGGSNDNVAASLGQRRRERQGDVRVGRNRKVGAVLL